MIPHIKPGPFVPSTKRKRPHHIVVEVTPPELSNILLSTEVERKYFLKWMGILYQKVNLDGYINIQVKLQRKI